MTEQRSLCDGSPWIERSPRWPADEQHYVYCDLILLSKPRKQSGCCKKKSKFEIAFFNLILIALALDVDEILIWFTTAPRFNTQALQDSLNLGQAKDKNQSQYLHVTSPPLNYFCDRKFRLKNFFSIYFLLEMNLCLLVVALVRLKHEKLVSESIKKYTQSTLWRSDYVLRVVKMCKMPREPWNINTHTQQTTKARKRRLQG